MAAALIAGAQEESREELAELWARLLANAMDPNMNSVRHSFIEAVRKMDTADAKIMHYLYSEKITRVKPAGDAVSNKDTTVEMISRRLEDRDDDVLVSIINLEDMGFLDTSTNDKNLWFPSAKLREFMRACYPELRP
jgi:hypothetical protein